MSRPLLQPVYGLFVGGGTVAGEFGQRYKQHRQLGIPDRGDSAGAAAEVQYPVLGLEPHALHAVADQDADRSFDTLRDSESQGGGGQSVHVHMVAESPDHGLIPGDRFRNALLLPRHPSVDVGPGVPVEQAKSGGRECLVPGFADLGFANLQGEAEVGGLELHRDFKIGLGRSVAQSDMRRDVAVEMVEEWQGSPGERPAAQPQVQGDALSPEMFLESHGVRNDVVALRPDNGP